VLRFTLPRRALILSTAAFLFPHRALASAPPSAYLPSDSYPERYHQKYALSCEYAALHTALYLLGHQIPEDTMLLLLGKGEDPDETFRGEIQANQTLTNYGVHARGIARLVDLLRANRLLPATVFARLLYDLDDVRAAIATSHPVIAWIPLDLRPSTRVPTRLSSGKTVTLVPAEHAVTLRGYDGSSFYALDPRAGAQRRYDTAALWRAMTLFDDPGLAIGPAEFALGTTGSIVAPTESTLGTVDTIPSAPAATSPAAPPTSEHFAETGITLEGGFYRAYLDSGGRAALGLPITEELTELDPTTGRAKQVLYSETARLEWLPDSGEFALGFVGQELMGDSAQPNPTRRLAGAIAQYVAAHGGLSRFGYSLSEEVPIPPDSDLLPHPASRAVGQWFQTTLLIWDSTTNQVIHARTGLALARQRGYLT